MVVTNTAVYDNDGWGSILNVAATRSDGTTACQSGDSGGPWFSSATSKVYGVQSFGYPGGGADCHYNAVSRMISAGFTVMTS